MSRDSASLVRRLSLGTLVTAGALNATQNTGTIDATEYRYLILQVQFTRGGTATAVVATAEESVDAGSTWSAMTLHDGAGVITPDVRTRTTSSTENFTLVYDVAALDQVRVKFDGTGATASDTATVVGSLAR